MTDPRHPINVLVVDDSPVARDLISHVLGSDPGIHVIGTAHNAREAIESIRTRKPDIVTMDIHMPDMDGFEATRIIMETNPLPIVMVTGIPNVHDLEVSFRAIEAGALAVLRKPRGIGNAGHSEDGRELITTVKLMSEIKVVRRWKRGLEPGSWGRSDAKASGSPQLPEAGEIRIVAIGASTGGPPVIEKILTLLPRDFPVPLLIVQHIAPGFIQGFAEWLDQKSPLPVRIASHNDLISAGHVYVAPDGVQIRVDRNLRLLCTNDGPENGLRPSVSYLFRSVAEVFGKGAAGVLLTGMGKDGAEELKLMRERGAVTIAQDEATSAVFGMPGEAVRIHAARYVLPPDGIAALLVSLIASKRKRPEGV